MDTIDESLGLSSYEDSVTSSLVEEDSTNDGKDTVLARYEKSIRSKENMNDEETEASEVTSLVEEESSDDNDEVSPRRKRSKKKLMKKNEAGVDPEGNYLHQNLRNTYKKQQTKNKRYGASTNKVKNEDHVRFALDEHDVVMEMMMKQNAMPLICTRFPPTAEHSVPKDERSQKSKKKICRPVPTTKNHATAGNS
eukprot:scaffold10631_cov88-Skeletonema_menzelii.AAC.1